MAMKKGGELLKDLFDISGKTALITGATGGFGHSASMALARARTSKAVSVPNRLIRSARVILFYLL